MLYKFLRARPFVIKHERSKPAFIRPFPKKPMGAKILSRVSAWFGIKKQRDFWRLIAIAACLHVALVLIIYLVGRVHLLSDTFDEHGIGISFAIDSASYRIEASKLAGLLGNWDIAGWIALGSQFHVKLYSICFATFGRVLGFNILSNEPLNLFYYLITLSLVFALTKEVFDRRSALVAMSIVGVWPSFLLHTTQMLRDPLFIAALLLLFLILVRWLTRTLSLHLGAIAGTIGGFACLFLWLSRGDMWEVIFVSVLVGCLFFIIRQIREQRLLAGNMIGVALLLAIALFMPRLVPAYRQTTESLTFKNAQPTKLEGQRASVWSQIPIRITLLRHNFIAAYPQAGSNIDTEVELVGIKDIIRYFPRAVLIGLMSPFPNMWFVAGANVGLKGGILSGAEALIMYLFIALAALTVWRRRAQLSVWMLSVIILVGATALGYVVVNISTLYRMRYAFWMLVIILGTDALVNLRCLSFSRLEGGAKDSPSNL